MGIVGGLLLGWIFGLFGFKGVVIAGMAQIFGVKITVLGYYFIFAMLGALGWLIQLFRRPRVTNTDSKSFEEFAKIFKK